MLIVFPGVCLFHRFFWLTKGTFPYMLHMATSIDLGNVNQMGGVVGN